LTPVCHSRRCGSPRDHVLGHAFEYVFGELAADAEIGDLEFPARETPLQLVVELRGIGGVGELAPLPAVLDEPSAWTSAGEECPTGSEG
jgi:hypothetical protein